MERARTPPSLWKVHRRSAAFQQDTAVMFSPEKTDSLSRENLASLRALRAGHPHVSYFRWDLILMAAPPHPPAFGCLVPKT